MRKISLGVPCYNAARYLGRLMESVRAQSMPFLDMVAYDDASTDDTAKVAESLGLRIIRGEINRGPAFARNRLAEASEAEWIHFHDADDLLDPRFVERMSAALGPDVDVVACQTDWINESTRCLEIAWRIDAEALSRDPILANLTHPVPVFSEVIRRETLLRVGGFDESLRTWEDADLQVRLSLSGARYRVVDEVLATSLRHSSGASSNTGQMADCQMRNLEAYVGMLPRRYWPNIGGEAEKLATRLLVEGVHPEVVDRCFSLFDRVGWNVPSTRNAFLRGAGVFIPRRWLLRIQAGFRRWRAEAPAARSSGSVR